jgi:AbrB family looped-hinge helix DNA binding protein
MVAWLCRPAASLAPVLATDKRMTDKLITPVICYHADMKKAHTKLTSQGQVSVPAAVRKALHLMPGSVLVWSQDGDRIVVERATRHSTAEVHQALFAGGPLVGLPAKSLDELTQGLKQAIRQRRPRPDAGR